MRTVLPHPSRGRRRTQRRSGGGLSHGCRAHLRLLAEFEAPEDLVSAATCLCRRYRHMARTRPSRSRAWPEGHRLPHESRPATGLDLQASSGRGLASSPNIGRRSSTIVNVGAGRSQLAGLHSHHVRGDHLGGRPEPAVLGMLALNRPSRKPYHPVSTHPALPWRRATVLPVYRSHDPRSPGGHAGVSRRLGAKE